MLDSMLSNVASYQRAILRRDVGIIRTEHATLFLHQRAQVPKYLMELMDPSLNFPDLCLALLNQRLLVGKLLWGKLSLEYLRLSLGRCWT